MAKSKKAPAKKDAKKGAELPALVVTSKAKEYIKSKGLKTASESIEAWNCKMYALLDQAIARGAGNKRATIRPQDF